MRVIDKILKQLTPERIKKENEAIQRVKLPPELQKWVKEYERVGERDEFVWKWAYKSVPIVTFSDILKKHQQLLIKVKVLIIMFIVLLDDVADRIKDETLLNTLLKIPFNKKEIKLNFLDTYKKEYSNFTQKLWRNIQTVVKTFPFYQKMKKIFEFDFRILLINAIYYGFLINKNHYLINKTEYLERFSYNIQGFLNLDLDLMCCYNKFDEQEIGTLREIAWHSQRIAQMLNWISTWEREIKENDFTSGIFAFAIDKKILAPDQLKRGNFKEIINRIKRSNLEKEILDKCDKEYHDVKLKGQKIRESAVNRFIQDLKKFLILQFCSKGYY